MNRYVSRGGCGRQFVAMSINVDRVRACCSDEGECAQGVEVDRKRRIDETSEIGTRDKTAKDGG